MTDSTLRVAIQGLYGAMVFMALLLGAIYHNDSTAFLSAILGAFAVVLSQSFAIEGAGVAADPRQTSSDGAYAAAMRKARFLWWASIILAAMSAAFLLIRG